MRMRVQADQLRCARPLLCTREWQAVVLGDNVEISRTVSKHFPSDSSQSELTLADLSGLAIKSYIYNHRVGRNWSKEARAERRPAKRIRLTAVPDPTTQRTWRPVWLGRNSSGQQRYECDGTVDA